MDDEHSCKYDEDNIETARIIYLFAMIIWILIIWYLGLYYTDLVGEK